MKCALPPRLTCSVWRAEVRYWDRTSAGIEDIKRVGLKGSPTVVSRVFGPTPRAQKAVQIAFDAEHPEAAGVALLKKIQAEFAPGGQGTGTAAASSSITVELPQ